MKGTLLLICLCLCIGCANVQVQRLPAYDYAVQMGGPDRPKLFSADTVKINNALTPYAVIIATGDKTILDRSVWRKAAEIKADVVIIKDGGSQLVGCVPRTIPYGYDMPEYRRPKTTGGTFFFTVQSGGLRPPKHALHRWDRLNTGKMPVPLYF